MYSVRKNLLFIIQFIKILFYLRSLCILNNYYVFAANPLRQCHDGKQVKSKNGSNRNSNNDSNDKKSLSTPTKVKTTKQSASLLFHIKEAENKSRVNDPNNSEVTPQSSPRLKRKMRYCRKKQYHLAKQKFTTTSVKIGAGQKKGEIDSKASKPSISYEIVKCESKTDLIIEQKNQEVVVQTTSNINLSSREVTSECYISNFKELENTVERNKSDESMKNWRPCNYSISTERHSRFQKKCNNGRISINKLTSQNIQSNQAFQTVQHTRRSQKIQAIKPARATQRTRSSQALRMTQHTRRSQRMQATKPAQVPRKPQATKPAQVPQELQKPQAFQASKFAQALKEIQESKELQATQEIQEVKANQITQPAQVPREPQATQEFQEPQATKQTKPVRASQKPQANQASKPAQDPRELTNLENQSLLGPENFNTSWGTTAKKFICDSCQNESDDSVNEETNYTNERETCHHMHYIYSYDAMAIKENDEHGDPQTSLEKDVLTDKTVFSKEEHQEFKEKQSKENPDRSRETALEVFKSLPFPIKPFLTVREIYINFQNEMTKINNEIHETDEFYRKTKETEFYEIFTKYKGHMTSLYKLIYKSLNDIYILKPEPQDKSFLEISIRYYSMLTIHFSGTYNHLVRNLSFIIEGIEASNTENKYYHREKKLLFWDDNDIESINQAPEGFFPKKYVICYMDQNIEKNIPFSISNVSRFDYCIDPKRTKYIIIAKGKTVFANEKVEITLAIIIDRKKKFCGFKILHKNY